MHTRLMSILPLFLMSLLSLAFAAGAQESIGDSTNLTSIIEQANRDGVRVVIIEPGAKAVQQRAAPSQPLLVQAQKTVREVKDRFLETLVAVPVYWSLTLKALQNGGGGRPLWWPLEAIGIAMLLLVAGWLPAKLYGLWAKNQFRSAYDPEPANAVAKISYLYFRAFSQSVEVVIQVGLAFLIALGLEFQPWGYRITVFLVLFGWLLFRGLNVYFSNMFAVGMPEYRLLALSDREASAMYRGASLVFIPMIVVTIGCVWQEMLGMDHNAHLLSLVGATGLSALLLLSFVFQHRKKVAKLILGDPARAPGVGRKLLASSWHLLALVYILIAYGVMFARLVLGLPNAMFLAIAPLLAIFGAITIFGAGLWLIEWIFGARAPSTAASTAAAAAASKNVQSAQADKKDAPDPASDVQDPPATDLDPDEEVTVEELPSYKGLFASWAQLFAMLAAGGWLLHTWGLPILSADEVSAAVWRIVTISLFAYLMWGIVKVAFDRKIAEEGGDIEIVPGEIGGAAGSRLATLLPLIRNFILILLGAIVTMMILVEMGVNIGPIFAGAGIVGLAIGFGAQTLVRDIISGVFFLIDDAFRKGEYIDIGSVKGTVEKISIRSMQLRHHNGPLNTVPFSEVQYITNYSRDWVVMKLPLRLTYDTDAEMVRKLIKKLGKELMEDPILGPLFLQPLKSQGVIQMEDSAMIMRVKFITKPGDQWGIRRIVFARLRDLFEEKGIKFANREVTVRVAQEDGSQPSAPQARIAAAGSAGRVIQDKAPDHEDSANSSPDA